VEIDPEGLSPAERYKLLIGGIVPRPIALVSTISPGGVANLAPFSFFNGVGSDPMVLLFCPVNRPDGSEKDTLRNAKPVAEGGTGQFVVNVASEPYAARVAGAAEPLAYEDSEFDLVGLTPAPGRRVRAPRVAEAPLAYECETMQVIRTNAGRPGGGNVVLGRVVLVHVAEGVADGRYRLDPDRLRAIARMGGTAYVRTRERFELPPGRDALGLRPFG